MQGFERMANRVPLSGCDQPDRGNCAEGLLISFIGLRRGPCLGTGEQLRRRLDWPLEAQPFSFRNEAEGCVFRFHCNPNLSSFSGHPQGPGAFRFRLVLQQHHAANIEFGRCHYRECPKRRGANDGGQSGNPRPNNGRRHGRRVLPRRCQIFPFTTVVISEAQRTAKNPRQRAVPVSSAQRRSISSYSRACASEKARYDSRSVQRSIVR